MRPHFSKKKLALANRTDRVIALNVFLRLTRDAENCLAALEMSHAVEESFLQLTGVSAAHPMPTTDMKQAKSIMMEQKAAAVLGLWLLKLPKAHLKLLNACTE